MKLRDIDWFSSTVIGLVLGILLIMLLSGCSTEPQGMDRLEADIEIAEATTLRELPPNAYLLD